MPIQVIPGLSRLRITYSKGVDGNGREIMGTKTYANVKPEASDEDVYAVASAFAGLQKYPVTSIGRVDEKKIIQG